MKQTLKEKIAANFKMAKYLVFWAVVIGVVLYAVYGLYWIGKSVSYSFFYEDMVIETTRDTVREMVKPESLK